MIRLVKGECGGDYTKLFEAMTRDIANQTVSEEFSDRQVSPMEFLGLS